MLKADPNYQRLRIGGRGWNGYASYWLAADHLLIVEVVNYTERYRRFYFRDLQAAFVQETRQQLWLNLALGLLVVFMLVIVGSALPASGNWSTEASVGVGICTGLGLAFFVGLVVNTVRGRTCSVHLRTAVQTHRLKNLNRWREAGRFLEQLQPRVLAVQSPTEPVAQSSGPPAPVAESGDAAPAGPATR